MWDADKWVEKVTVDKRVIDASPDDYDALLLPSGLFNPDTLRQDKDASANWVDQAVYVDNSQVTSRTSADLEAFNRQLIEEILEGKH